MKATLKPETFITSVNLSIPFEHNRYQFVYGSQLYGTLFAVYGRFHSSKQPNNKIKINKIALKLVNYRGCVNMGIRGKPFLCSVDNKPAIIFRVKALKTSADPVFIDFGSKGLDVSDGEEIIFQRRAVPFRKRFAGSDTTGRSPQYKFFDTEFNYRDGYFEDFAPRRAGDDDATDLELDDHDHPSLRIASPRCHQSFVQISI